MRLLKYLTFAVLTAAIITSCDSSGSNTQSFSMDMVYYASTASSESYSYGSTQFNLDYSDPAYCSMVVSGLLVPGIGNSMTYRYDNLTMVGTTSGFTLVSGSQAATKVECSIGGPWMNTTFSVSDGSASILAMSRSQVFYSITTVTSPDGNILSTSQADQNLFMITINEANISSDDRSLNFLIKNAHFKDNMSVSLQLKNINFQIVDGRLLFSADELPVYLSSGDLPSEYEVLNFAASGKIGGDYTVSFVWRELGSDDSTTDYQVQTTLKTLLSSSSSN